MVAMGMGVETRTLVLVNLAGIMERADEALLPAVYKEVGAALDATPTALGSLTLFRSIVQTCCYPLAAYMSMRYDRTHVVALGAFLWSAATFLVAVSTTFLQVLFLMLPSPFPTDWNPISLFSYAYLAKISIYRLTSEDLNVNR